MPKPTSFFSVEYIGSCGEREDNATLADPKSCPNIGDHFIHCFDTPAILYPHGLDLERGSEK